VVGRSSIVAAPEVDPEVDRDPVDRDSVPGRPRTDLEARAAPCIPHGLSPVALPAPADAQVLVRRAQALALALVLAPPGLASEVPAA
jgi:hypothetical protein